MMRRSRRHRGRAILRVTLNTRSARTTTGASVGVTTDRSTSTATSSTVCRWMTLTSSLTSSSQTSMMTLVGLLHATCQYTEYWHID